MVQLKALQLLHNKCSLVHMDVKPDNICLARPPAARNGARSKVPAGAALIDFTTTVPHSRADGSIPSTAEVGSHAYTSLRYFVSPSETVPTSA
jgi:serine/threonine protein kinase